MPKQPPKLDPAQPKQNFALNMRRLRLRAGDPSLQELARAMSCTHSTVSAYLNGQRLPPPRQLESFVLACKGNTAEWLQRLEAVREQLETSEITPAELPADEAGTARYTDDAAGASAASPEVARRAAGQVPPSGLAPKPAPTLLETFRNVARTLRDCLVKDADGKPTGWWPDLRGALAEKADGRPTGQSGEQPKPPDKTPALSTAYGIRTMLLLEDGLAADLIPVAESLRRSAVPDGGYAGREQSEPRSESTAAVLNALGRIAATDDFDAHIAQMERDLKDFEKYRPFILTTMLETSLLLKPETRLVETLVSSLLEARHPYEGLMLWPEKAEPLLIDPAPSVAHTARAVRVLASAQAIQPSSQVQEAMDQAVTWLIDQRDLHNAYEVTERMVDGKPELVHVRHFTAAWVVKALVSAGVPAAHPAVSHAVARIWDSYGDGTPALWAWDNGDLPIWMTFDAVEALRLANLAVPARPGW
jgi:transcriptional regulator with XRE-family HTH domain